MLSTVFSPGRSTSSKITPRLSNSVTVATMSSTVKPIWVKVPGDARANWYNANSPFVHL